MAIEMALKYLSVRVALRGGAGFFIYVSVARRKCDEAKNRKLQIDGTGETDDRPSRVRVAQLNN